MAIDVEVFGALIEALIIGDVGNKFVVTIHNSNMGWFNLEISREVAQPLDFTRYSG